MGLGGRGCGSVATPPQNLQGFPPCKAFQKCGSAIHRTRAFLDTQHTQPCGRTDHRIVRLGFMGALTDIDWKGKVWIKIGLMYTTEHLLIHHILGTGNIQTLLPLLTPRYRNEQRDRLPNWRSGGTEVFAECCASPNKK